MPVQPPQMSSQQSQVKRPQQEQEFSIRKSIITASYESATFFITRYPYLCAVLLMITTAEQLKEQNIKRNSLQHQIIYVHLGVYFTCGTIMAFDLFGLKRFFAIVTTFHLGFVSYTEYNLTFGENIAYRLLTRNIACMGCYLMVAGGIAKNKGDSDRSQRLVSFGRQFIGVYSVLVAVLAWNDQEEFDAFAQIVPRFGELFAYVILVVNILLGLCLYGEYRTIQCSKLYAILLLFITVFVDANIPYWEKTTKLRTWGIITIATRHTPILCALILIRRGYY